MEIELIQFGYFIIFTHPTVHCSTTILFMYFFFYLRHTSFFGTLSTCTILLSRASESIHVDFSNDRITLGTVVSTQYSPYGQYWLASISGPSVATSLLFYPHSILTYISAFNFQIRLRVFQFDILYFILNLQYMSY